MRPTVGQASKRRKKVEATATFFETVVDQELRAIGDKLTTLKKIYLNGMQSLASSGSETADTVR